MTMNRPVKAKSNSSVLPPPAKKLKMREQDHQLIQDVHIHAHTDEGVTFDYDNSGFGLVTESTVTMAAADSPTTCQMKRP